MIPGELLKKSVYIGNVRFVPASSIEKPYLFGTIEAAKTFAYITGHAVYAVVPSDDLIYRFWPSGKTEMWQGGKIEKSFDRKCG